MLCGFGVERSLAELEVIGPEARAALATAPVWILDGNAYTSRPGPRLVDGAERIAAAYSWNSRRMTGSNEESAGTIRRLSGSEGDRIAPADQSWQLLAAERRRDPLRPIDQAWPRA